MMKSYLLKKEFFISNHKEQIKEHFEFIKVQLLRSRKWDEEPMASSIKSSSGSSPIAPGSSNAFPNAESRTLPPSSTNSRSWRCSITLT